jgi:sulfate permease, SulP family
MLQRWLPSLVWVKDYNQSALISDLMAAIIVTIMLIPQSLAYALLAGLPPEMGLYASILPLVAYALLGTSRTLSVGPVAVVSLMTATTIGSVAQQGTVDYATAAITLALMSGLILLALGFLRFGFITNFLSHPVVSGFITASGVIIALSQLGHILGIRAHGETAPELLLALGSHIPETNFYTLAVGSLTWCFLFLCRSKLSPVLVRAGLSQSLAGLLSRAAPVLAIILTIGAALAWDLASKGVAIVGQVPSGLPAFSLPNVTLSLVEQLALPALLISLIGFVESVSVGKTLGAKRRQRIDANQELIGLGAANVASAVSGGFPVTGGFSRSVVNFDAGAETQAASLFTAIGIALAALFLTPVLYYLPKATLAATIIVAVTSLIDIRIIREAWRYSRSDFIAVFATIFLTLLLGVEMGVIAGVSVSIGMHLYKTSRPHFAIVGTVPGTEHYRNIDRHDVLTYPNILSLRIDESLYFANASYLEDIIYTQLSEHPEVEHVVLMCPAVNDIDLSALEALEEISTRLSELAISLHLSEVKGPVMDRLRRSHFLEHLSGKVYLNHHAAIHELSRF